MGPTQEINAQFAAFLAAFRAVEESYVSTLNQASTGTVAVSTTLTASYAAGSPTMQVADAAVFGPSGVYSTPVLATASLSGNILGQYLLTGSSGNQLVIDVAKSSYIPLNSGTVLSANVPVSAQNTAAAIFPSYIDASTTQLAVKLLQYFNSLPIKLPRKFALPHQDPQTGAIQQLVYQRIAGDNPSSLKEVLMAITLPTTPGGDLQIYDATVNTAVESTRLNVVSNVQQLLAGKLIVAPLTITPSMLLPSNTPTGTASPTSTGTSAGTTGGT